MNTETNADKALEWQDSYKLGYADIDAEHEWAFKLANQCIAAKDQAGQTLAVMQLYQHTRVHFEHEEAMMRAVKFPDAHGHAERHNLLIGRLNVISQGIAQGDVNKQALVDLMTDWAMHHIVQDDAQFASFVALK
jgi:hemerythrin-like metal-binding protein